MGFVNNAFLHIERYQNPKPKLVLPEYVRFLPVSGHIPGPGHSAPPPMEPDRVRERLRDSH